MRIAVFGATGSVGRHVVTDATGRGHEVVPCARSTGVDLVTAAGVDAALEGCAVAIDVSNVATLRRSRAFSFFEATARTLQGRAGAAKVGHLVVLSIVGVERVRMLGYYAAKLAQERLVLNGAVPTSVLRATQFHELPGALAARGSFGPLTTVPALRVQTVAARAVASRLVDLAVGEPSRGIRPDLAGPGPVATMPGLARATLAAAGSSRRVLAVPLPPRARRAVDGGALLPAGDAELVGPSFAAWLEGPDGPR